MTLTIGQMRHRVRFERLVQEEDPDFGGPVGDPKWVLVAEVWAKRTNMLRPSAEAIAGGVVIAPVQVRFDIRPLGIGAADRGVGVKGDHDGVIYDIQGVGDGNDLDEMAVMCTSGASSG